MPPHLVKMSYNVTITEKMKQTARKWSDYIESKMKKGKNYTGVELHDRFYFGYLGEFAFGEYLKEKKIKSVYYPQPDGKSGPQDFDVWLMTGSKQKVDVKCSPLPTHRMLLVNKAEYEANTHDIYVGVRLHGDDAEIMGYSTITDMRFTNDGFTDKSIPTYWRNLNDLSRLEHLEKICIQGELEVQFI